MATASHAPFTAAADRWPLSHQPATMATTPAWCTANHAQRPSRTTATHRTSTATAAG